MTAWRIFSTLTIAALSFCGGYAYSEYRQHAVLYEVERAQQLSNAETALRAVKLLSTQGPEQARSGLLVIARSLVDTDRAAPPPVTWSLPAFGVDPGTEFLRARNEGRRVTLQQELARAR